MITKRNRFIRLGMPALFAVMLAGTAQAVDLRSWDQKISSASNRFIVLASFNNEAVLDKETQLVWQRKPANQVSNWNYARDYCIAGAFAGRRGWRLPSVHELSSLAEASAPAGTLALPQGHPFQNVPIGRYWSSTRQANQYTNQTDGGAYAVILYGGGGITSAVITVPFYYWCVRGGGPISEY